MAMLVNPVEATDLPVRAERLRRVTHEVYAEVEILGNLGAREILA